MKSVISWVKQNPNKLGVILWAFYEWAKAVAHARFQFDFLPQTDGLIMTALTGLGLHSVTRKTPPAQ